MTRSSWTRRGLVGAGVAGAAAASGATTVLAQGAPPALGVAPTSQAGLGPRLTMHAIDTFHGTPGVGMRCDLAMLDGETYRPLKTITTAANGRSPEPLLVDDALKTGRYELQLHLADYFRMRDVKLPSPTFLAVVPVRFVIRDASQRYHLPVLFSPWGYSYYRGS